MANSLVYVKAGWGPAFSQGKKFSIAFDLNYSTQKFIHSWLSKGQLCDPPLSEILTCFLEVGDTFLDIGSHVGYFSLLASQMVGDEGAVYAFEANPQTFGVLVASVAANRGHNFFAYNCAVGDKEGVATLSICKEDEGRSSMVMDHGQNISVFVTTLDDLMDRLQFRRVRMVKIDVEGFEQAVIQGGQRFFSSDQVESVVFEVNTMLSGNEQDIILRKYFAKLGYRSYLIRPWHVDGAWADFYKDKFIAEIPDGMALEIPYCNVLATRRKLDAPCLEAKLFQSKIRHRHPALK